MKKITKAMTAVEADEFFKSDPEWVRQYEERESQRKSLEKQLSFLERLLVADLANIEIKVTSVWDLVNQPANYIAAIPILVRHLQLPYHPKIKEGIVRALTVKEARGVAGRAILNELKRTELSASEMRWLLANALRKTTDESMHDDLKKMIADAQYDDVRNILKSAVRNSKKTEEPNNGVR